MMMDEMKAENEKLAAAGGGGDGNSKLEEILAAKQAELMVRGTRLLLSASLVVGGTRLRRNPAQLPPLVS